jgi:quinol monooxygenase YgiN
MSGLTKIVLMRAQAGKSRPLGDALRDMVALSRSEPGCAICELNHSADDPDTWMVYERWRSTAAFDSHMAQSYVARFLAQMSEWIAEPPRVQSYDIDG